MDTHDPHAAHYPVDAHRTDLLEEFVKSPRGPHSDELQKVLHRMRWEGDPLEIGRYVAVVLEPGRRWALARLPRERYAPVQFVDGVQYSSMADAERDVFRRRWDALLSRKCAGEGPK
jgi:hypothetical protein